MAFLTSDEIKAMYPNIGRHIPNFDFVTLALAQWDALAQMVDNSMGGTRSQIFVVSGSFSIPATTLKISGSAGGGAGSSLWGCGGGAGEAVFQHVLTGLTIGEIVNIEIGFGGIAGYNFGSVAYTVSALQSLEANYHVSGYAGGDTKFGNYLTLKGGKGASVGQAFANPGLNGGLNSQPGELPSAMQGATKIRNGGRGGGNLFGLGGVGGIHPYSGVATGTKRDGTDGTGWGGGGAGGGDYTDGTTLWATGAGDGAPGVLWIEW